MRGRCCGLGGLQVQSCCRPAGSSKRHRYRCRDDDTWCTIFAVWQEVVNVMTLWAFTSHYSVRNAHPKTFSCMSDCQAEGVLKNSRVTGTLIQLEYPRDQEPHKTSHTILLLLHQLSCLCLDAGAQALGSALPHRLRCTKQHWCTCCLTCCLPVPISNPESSLPPDSSAGGCRAPGARPQPAGM